MGKQARAIVDLSLKELVKDLNKAYADEWLAFYLYWYMAQIVSGRAYEDMQEFLNKIAKDELEHAQELADLIIKLNKIGARHGVGISLHLEDRVIGMKIRDLYEAPAAEIIITAHRELEKYVSTRAENEFKQTVDTKWAYLCYGALWLEPLMDDLNSFIDRVNQKVTGIVRLQLYKGRATVVTVETPNTIFEQKLATFMTETTFNQNASAGFIELYTLQMRLSQRSEKTALLSFGQRRNKIKLLSVAKALYEMKYKIYATYKTHKFLKANRIEAILVNKISSPHLKPNLLDMLQANRFDLIINIPTAKDESSKEKTDGQLIREYALKKNALLITNTEVAKKLIAQLQR